jgi:hypothetical protein
MTSGFRLQASDLRYIFFVARDLNVATESAPVV